ncbi:phosphomannomutase/phosphoglucomutase [Paucidesulfovibrio longus]|uniref:phosphomannomutase/phosphoglucomutase n=1 Tax=Paucidesulfovibrio longus TaxID=889 RepID=UPI0003B6FAF0|nr:phosphomannomutase/phosphoglucomutase [Paucidesulfovibrio longus]
MKIEQRAVFRAYDIRGVAGVDFDAAWVEELGRALGAWYLSRGLGRAVLGRDCRATSPEYLAALARGLASTGVDVILAGLLATPMLYHAVRTLRTRAGVMVTASHNPPRYNGFKLWGGDCVLSPEEILQVRDLMDAGDHPVGRGVVSSHDPIPAWLEEVSALERLEPRPGSRPLRVVVDGGNGSAGELTALLLERAAQNADPEAASAPVLEVERLFCEPDGTFPNHHPDPVVESNMERLKARVLETGADLGVGLDGDGDRIGVVDETGRLWPGDRLLALFARDVLRRAPGARIIADVKCSHLLFRDIAAHGGVPVMGVTGHSIMKRALKEQGAALAGEMSGHMFFGEGFFGWDDAPYAALRLASLLVRSVGPLSAMLDDWPESWATPEIRMPCPEASKFDVVRRVREDLAARFDIIDVDGVRVVFPDGWGLVRASNTQAELTLRFEAESEARLAEIERLIREAVERARRSLG